MPEHSQTYVDIAVVEKDVLKSKILNRAKLPFALLSLLRYFNTEIAVEDFGQSHM